MFKERGETAIDVFNPDAVNIDDSLSIAVGFTKTEEGRQGGGLARNALSSQLLSRVTGGYLRRFRQMGG